MVIHVDFSIKEVITATMVLFAVIDIIGNIPMIVSLHNKVGEIQSGKASIVSGVIMISFLFLGESILDLIGIDVNSFAVAGSFIFFFFALEMILGITLFKDDEPETASIVPLAFPLIAGAGSLTSILSLKAELHTINIIIGIVLNLILVYIVLRNSEFIGSKLGKSGLGVIRKIFGIILLAIAVKLFTTNIQGLI
ncbi:MAG: MarC family protein [Ichthyobacteriaceae bacterium]|nr:MarC family protein [Ichthyobacteriaceae bacterium]